MNNFSNDRKFVLGFVAACLLFALFSWFFYEYCEGQIREEMRKQHNNQLEENYKTITRKIIQDRQSISFLSDVPPVQGVVRSALNEGVDPYDGTPYEEWKRRLETIFRSYMVRNSDINQIRFIGQANDGQELIRVQREGGSVVVVDDVDLQSKSHTKYFKEIAQLSSGRTYVSEIELNREHGVLDFPEWPTYRIAINVFDKKSEYFGFLIINFNAEVLFQELQDEHTLGDEVYVINQNGDFLMHPDRKVEFAFERGQPVRWGDYFQNPIPAGDGKQWSPLLFPDGEEAQYLHREVSWGGGKFPKVLHIIEPVKNKRFSAAVIDRFDALFSGLVAVFIIGSLIIFFYHRALVARRSLRQTEKQYQALFDSAQDAIVIVDNQLQVIRCNSAAEEMFEIPKDDLQSRLLDSYTSNAKEETAASLIRRAFSGERLLPQEILCFRGDERKKFYGLATFSNMYKQEGGLAKVSLTIRDITEQKLAEAVLKDSNEHLEKLVKERTHDLHVALMESERITESKSLFLANMSHEIRTPMNGVYGMLGLLRREPLTPRQLNNLEMAETSIRALTELVNDILDFSKIEQGKLEIENSEFNLLELLHSCSASISVAMRSKGIQMIADFNGIAHAIVSADSNRIRQILNNLLSNALKFTNRGEIALVARTEQDQSGNLWLHCAVQDSGIGISEENITSIFESFSQESSSISQQYGGTGLGLSICKQLCELMGGQISVESTKNQGSTFAFRLPISVASVDADAPFIDMNTENILVCLSSQRAADVVCVTLAKWGASTETCDIGCIRDSLCETSDFSMLLIEQGAYLEQRSEIETYRGGQRNREVLLLLADAMNHSDKSTNDGLLDDLSQIDQPITPVNLFQILPRLWPMRFVRRGTELLESRGSQPVELILPSHTILVVDDHRINRELISGLLESSGAKILTARDGQEALSLLNAHKMESVSLILMDCQMPVLDGYEAARKIRAGEAGQNHRHTPIIALTAATMSGDKHKCLEAGMNDYLSKPFESQQLFQKMYTLLGKAQVINNANDDNSSNRETFVEADNNSRAVPVWDKKSVLTRLNQNEELLMRILPTFLNGWPSIKEELEKQQETINRDSLKYSIHALKGSAASVGGVQVYTKARNLEQLIEELPDESLIERIQQLIHAVEALNEKLRAALEVAV